MYKGRSEEIIYSPSDLILYMRSPFASWMDRLAIEKPDQVADITQVEDLLLDLLAQQGNRHEENFLNFLCEEYGQENIAVIDAADRQQALQNTVDAMRNGSKVIFQAYLQRDDFAGHADFLIRQTGNSQFGDYYYEAWDTKLARTSRPYFLVQLCCYSWILEGIQGVLPENMVVVLGNREPERYRVAAYFSYFLCLKDRFMQIQNAFYPDEGCRPDPALYSDHGRWASHAKILMENTDSLALVANIRKSQIKKLGAAGITSLSGLASTGHERITGINEEAFQKLKTQAIIQAASRNKELPYFQILHCEDGKGLSTLPPAAEKDVYFDIEGYPLLEGGLEYLWGVSYRDENAPQGNTYAFKDWWAHSPEQEKTAFEGFIDWVCRRWQADPAMHVYHYASYEVTALRKLSTRHETRQEQVDELLRHRVLIDLYKIVREGLLLGEPRYSIKNIEHLYRGRRDTGVASGVDSVVQYENWRELGGAERWSRQDDGYRCWLNDPEHFHWEAWPELMGIRDYNIDDCESTLELVAWLRKQQHEENIQYIPPYQEHEQQQTPQKAANEERRNNLKARQQALIQQFNDTDELQNNAAAAMLVSLLGFHERERKPKVWAYFDRLDKQDDELFEDDSAICHVCILEQVTMDNGRIQFVCSYDGDQPVRKDKFNSGIIREREIKVTAVNFSQQETGEKRLAFEIDQGPAQHLPASPFTLLGQEANIRTDKLEERLCDITEYYFNHHALSGAVATMLTHPEPRFLQGSEPLPITRNRYRNNDTYIGAIIDAVGAMDQTCLCIQGPPGSGKSYTAAKVIASLIDEGKRVGIMSNSHAAIMNLMEPLCSHLPDTRLVKVGGLGSNQAEFRKKYPEHRYPNLVYRPSMGFTQAQPYESFSLIGATIYAFAHEFVREYPLDYLFVDEASQVALANLIAVSGTAKNIVLMGDQRQLEQPIQGAHPCKAGSSALEFMLGEHDVIPENQGIFLERTFRMHPNVCKPLSDMVYEGKLQSDENNHLQAVDIPSPRYITCQNGILPVPVLHEGNRQSSLEEVELLKKMINELLTGTFTDKGNNTRAISYNDILVVAPYNMQVNLLKEHLPAEMKIGTIDKFQGQEAPVVIISMAVSDVEDSARGLDFVFDINRLNVAISRAQALAIIVSNKGLQDCHVSSLKQMERVSFYCRLNNTEKFQGEL